MSEQNQIHKIDSNTSIGSAEQTPNQSKDKIGVTDETQLMTDICNLLIFCQKHQKICVSNVPSKGLWMPSIVVQWNDSWTQSISSLLEMVGIDSVTRKRSSARFINIYRIQLTQTCNFVTRVTYLVVINNTETKESKDSKKSKKSKESKCCENIDKYKWISIKTVLKNDSNFCGPEVKQMIGAFISNEDKVFVNRSDEYDTKDALKDFCDQPSICTTKEQMMIRSACFGEKDIIKLYDIFFRHCYPSEFMSFQSFKIFIKRIGIKISENNLIPTFRAIDRFKNNYLSFNDLLLGIAAMDQAVEHGGQFGELRLQYLFRYYDSDLDGFLSQSDVSQMIVDIRDNSTSNSIYKTTFNTNTSSAETLADQVIQSHGSNGKISLQEFTESVGDLKFRGTSVLFRAPGPTIRYFSMKASSEHMKVKHTVALVKNNKYDFCCENCRKKTFSISKNLYIMTKRGEVLDIPEMKNNFVKNTDFKFDYNPEVFDLAIEVVNRVNKLYLHRFKNQSKHITEKQIKESAEYINWFYPTKGVLIKKLITICEKSKQLLSSEERVLSVPTPCYIFGDIHGNLKDLIIFANDLWRTSPLLNESNYLFLGDYVDRGDSGVECVAYLLALKLIAPKNFWLCRGNHEVRQLQEAFTFYRECVDNYNKELWDAFNEVFDVLPIAAIVDNKLFCSHGGIPTTTNSVQNLRSVPSPLNEPMYQSPAVWEILWNDPMPDEEFRQLSAFQRQEIEKMNGFLDNIKRGTAYYYSELAVNDFLQHNKLQFIIRGHECVQNGYKFLMNGRVITMFSTSKYCGQSNEASVLFVNQSKLRVIRIHTFQ